MAEDRPLHDLIAELRTSDPDWQSSIVRFRQHRRQQAISYERGYRAIGQTGQQRECICRLPVHQSADGRKDERDGSAHYCGEYLLV